MKKLRGFHLAPRSEDLRRNARFSVHVTRVVPESNHRPGDLVFITQGADAGRTQHEISAVGCGLDPQPPGRQDTDEMPAGEKQDVSLNRTHAIDNPVGAGTDLLRRLASGAAVAEQV